MYNVIMKADNLHHLVWMSRPLMQAAEVCVEAGLEGTGLTVRMRAVLEILHRHGAQTVPDIANKLEINRQYVQVMCNEVLAAGFVEQRENPRHKRSTLLTLTDTGRDLIKEIISREMMLLDEIGSALQADDISKALEVVLAVTNLLKKTAGERK